MLTEIKLIAAAVALGALITGGLWLHHSAYESGIAHCQAQTAAAERQAQTQHKAQLARAASVQTHITHTGAVTVAASEAATHETVRYITRVVHDHPAPAACVAAPDSVHALQRAVSAADAAAGQLSVAPARASTATDP